MARVFVVRKLALGELLDEAFSVLKSCFGRLLAFQGLVYGPSLLLSAYGVKVAGEWLEGLISGEVAPNLPALVVGVVGFFMGFLALQVVLGAITQVALAKGAADTYLAAEPYTVRSLFRSALRLFPRSCLLGLFLTVVLIVSFSLPIAAIAGAGVVVATSGGGAWAAAILLGLLGGIFGLVALAGATYLYLRWALAGTVLAVEGSTLTEALRRSAELMRARYWGGLALLGILIAIGFLLGGVLSIAVPSPSFEGKDLGEIRTLLPELVRSQMLSQVLGQIAGALTGLYTSVCWTLFYFSARCEQEGFDVAHQAKQLGKE